MEKKLLQLKSYSQKGFPIFPLNWMIGDICSCGSNKCRSPGKHPLVTRGFKDASTDIEQIIAWHEKWPQANWGMRTGDCSNGGSGVLVIDIDHKNNGFSTWEMLETDHPELIETVTVDTGGGGQHIWFQYPSGVDIRSGAGVLGRGVDIRANGGYVVAPPSRTTKEYRFDLNPIETEISLCPNWILAELNGRVIDNVSNDSSVNGLIHDEVPQGERHQALVTLASSMRGSGMQANEIKAALQVIRDKRFSSGDHPVPDEEINEVVDWVCEKKRNYAFTDLGNAERFIDQHKNIVRYYSVRDKWLIWDEKHWALDDTGYLTRLAHNTARSIYNEAANSTSDNNRKAIAKHAIRSEARSRIENMLHSSKPYLAVRPDQLDQHPMLLNVANGIIDLTTGNLMPHDRELLLTKKIDVEYHLDAECPEWEKFLDLVTGGDKELQFFLQLAVGYTLTGLTDEHCLFFLYGTGQNGKTTFTETIRRLLSDYTLRVDIEALLQSWGRGQAATPQIAGMAGSRYVLASEVPENRKINESLVKDLTGGDTITARYLFANPFTFDPTHKLWLFGNYKPRISGTDEGIWRRIRIIPFNVIIPKEIRRPMSEVLQKFEAEKVGILTWMITGCLLWQSNGLQMVGAVENATSEYRTEQDLVQQFLEEKCEMGLEYSIMKDTLYTTWREWCDAAGEKESYKRTKKWLTQQMTKRGYKHGGAGKQSLLGLRLGT